MGSIRQTRLQKIYSNFQGQIRSLLQRVFAITSNNDINLHQNETIFDKTVTFTDEVRFDNPDSVSLGAESLLESIQDAAKSTQESGHYKPLVVDDEQKPTVNQQQMTDTDGIKQLVSKLNIDSKGHVVSYETTPDEPEYDDETNYNNVPQNDYSWIHIYQYSTKDQKKHILHIPLEGALYIHKENSIKYGYLRNTKTGTGGMWTKCDIILSKNEYLNIANNNTVIEAANGGASSMQTTMVKNLRDGLATLNDGTSTNPLAVFETHQNYYRVNNNTKKAFVQRQTAPNPNLYSPQLGSKFQFYRWAIVGSRYYYRLGNVGDYTYCPWEDFNGTNKRDEAWVRFELFDINIDEADCETYRMLP